MGLATFATLDTDGVPLWVSIEKGHFDPRLSLAFRIGQLFDVPLDEVFTPDGS